MSELDEKALTAAWMRFLRIGATDRDKLAEVISIYLAAAPAPTVSGEQDMLEAGRKYEDNRKPDLIIRDEPFYSGAQLRAAYRHGYDFARDRAGQSPAPTVSGEVKPLEWVAKSGGWYADCYRIRIESGYYIVSGWAPGTNPYENLDAAKAAAQADYEQRIRSALIPAPTRAEVLEEAAKVADEMRGGASGSPWAWACNSIATRLRALAGEKP